MGPANLRAKTTKDPHRWGSFASCELGGVLLSQGLSTQVPSALEGLTSVFGMGTGVTPPPWPPKSVAKWSAAGGGAAPWELHSEHEHRLSIQALGRLVPVG